MRTALLMLLTVIALRAAEAVTADGADAAQAVRLFQRELERIYQAEPPPEMQRAIAAAEAAPGASAATTAEREALATAVNAPASREAFTEQLTDVLVEATLSDTALAISKGNYRPVSQPIYNTKDLQGRGPAGTLWCFWAVDAPSTGLAGQLLAFRRAREDIRLAEVNLVPLSAWLTFLRHIRGGLDALRTVTLSPNADLDRQLKHQRVQELVGPYMGVNDMVAAFRPGGYRIFDDTTVAHALDVTTVPCFRFVSQNGVMHKIDGLNTGFDLAQWVATCELWERDHLQEEYRRAFPTLGAAAGNQ